MRHWPRSSGTSFTWFGLVKEKRQNFACIPMSSSMLSHFPYVLFPQLLSQGGLDVPTLLADMARAREAAAAAKAIHAVAMLAVETSA
jgi:hypothetical protein